MTQTAIIGKLKYVSTERTKRGTGTKGLMGKLKYFQYRDDRDGHVPQGEEARRWYNRGLGSSYGTIFKNCLAEKSPDVLAWTWMISPSPSLMELVPEDQRQDVVAELTDNVVEAYYEARDLPPTSYSFVIHDRETKGGAQQVHSHVVLSGTVYGDADWHAEAVYNNVKDGDFKLFKEIVNHEMEVLLDRAIGPDWRLQLEDEPTVAAPPALAELTPDALADGVPRPTAVAVPPLPDSDNLEDWFPRTKDAPAPAPGQEPGLDLE